MTLPPALSKNSQAYALNTIQNIAAQIQTIGSGAVSTMASSSVNTVFIFNLLDGLSGVIANLNSVKNTAGLDAYATAQIPNYTGTMSTDITATVNAAQAAINWVVTNFPKDSTNLFILAESINSDGSRTSRTFTSAQTAGFQTALNTLLATVG